MLVYFLVKRRVRIFGAVYLPVRPTPFPGKRHPRTDLLTLHNRPGVRLANGRAMRLAITADDDGRVRSDGPRHVEPRLRRAVHGKVW